MLLPPPTELDGCIHPYLLLCEKLEGHFRTVYVSVCVSVRPPTGHIDQDHFTIQAPYSSHDKSNLIERSRSMSPQNMNHSAITFEPEVVDTSG